MRCGLIECMFTPRVWRSHERHRQTQTQSLRQTGGSEATRV